MGGGLTRKERRALQRAKLAELEAKQASSSSLHDRISASLGVFLSSAIAAFVVPIVASFTVSAFAAAGVIDMILARIFLAAAFAFCTLGLTVFAFRFWTEHRSWIALSMVLIAGVTFLLIDKVIDRIRPEDPFKGEIIAGSKPKMGKLDCPGADKPRFNVRIGAVTFLVSSFPRTLLTIGGKPILRLDINDQDRMEIYAEIFDNQGKVIAVIDKNTFQINQNNVFRKERPSRSALAIFDQYNERVLDIEFRNENEITIVGTLWYRKGVQIRAEALLMSDGTTLSVPDGICITGQLNVN